MRAIMQIDYDFLFEKIKICGDISKESYYSKNKINFKKKKDGSQVTDVDEHISQFLKKEIYKKYPNIPFFSEEEINNPEKITSSENFFMLDPIDGTSSYIEKNPEYTINLSLVSNEKILFSCIYSPIYNILYYANLLESFKIYDNTEKKLKNYDDKQLSKYRVITTRREDELFKIKKMLDKNKIKYEFIHLSSALKFGYLSEGNADIYIRRAKIKLWDVISGFHIANNAGYIVKDSLGNNFHNYLVSRDYLSKIINSDFRIDEFIIQNSEKYKVIF